MPRTLNLLLIFLSSLACEATPPPTKEDQTTENLVTFSRLYGYVRYFHPTDAAYDLDWDTFARYGAEKIMNCSTPAELRQELTRLFKPIAPTLAILNEDDTANPAPLVLSLDSIYTFWQHQGVDLGADGRKPTYQSKRVKLQDGQLRDSLFGLQPERILLTEPIGSGLACQLPIVLSEAAAADDVMADSLAALEQRLKNYSFDIQDAASRLGNIVIAHNTFQHFYPYFNVVEVDWQQELRTAIERSLTDSSEVDHLLTLQRMTAALEDGHVGVYHGAVDYYPPIYWEWINDTLTVAKVFDSAHGVEVGDIVTDIDGRSVTDHFADIWPRISAGTQGWRNYRSQREALSGAKDTELSITVDDRVVSLPRTLAIGDYYPQLAASTDTFKVYDDGVLYVNLDLMPMPELDSLLPHLAQADGLIFDLRGYPKGNHYIINHFMIFADTTSAWMQVPQQVYPDQQSPRSFVKFNWIEMMQPKQPYLGNIPKVFLTDGRAISYAESFMGYIKHYQLATIMGQPTAGANGNVNILELPGDYYITFTGMRVVKHDGSQLHGVGFEPDITIERTVEAVRRGEDEYIEAARAYLRENR